MRERDHARARLNAAGRLPARDVEIRWCQREPLKLKSGRDGTAHQGPVAGAARGLPVMRRNDDLRGRPVQIRAKLMILRRPLIGGTDREDQRRTCVPEPDLGRIDPVPVACLTRCQQKINAGACGTPGAGSTPGLSVVAAFRMRGEVQMRDDLLCCHRLRLVWAQLRAKGESR